MTTVSSETDAAGRATQEPKLNEEFELIGSHPHAGTRVKLVQGSTPDMVEGIRVEGVFMALCETEDGQRFYAERRHLAQIQLKPLVSKRKRRR